MERFLWNVNDARHVSFWTNVCLRVAVVKQNSVYVLATVKLHCGRSQNHQSRWLTSSATNCRQFRRDIHKYNCALCLASIQANESNFSGGPSVFQVQGEVYKHRDCVILVRVFTLIYEWQRATIAPLTCHLLELCPKVKKQNPSNFSICERHRAASLQTPWGQVYIKRREEKITYQNSSYKQWNLFALHAQPHLLFVTVSLTNNISVQTHYKPYPFRKT